MASGEMKCLCECEQSLPSQTLEQVRQAMSGAQDSMRNRQQEKILYRAFPGSYFAPLHSKLSGLPHGCSASLPLTDGDKGTGAF